MGRRCCNFFVCLFWQIHRGAAEAAALCRVKSRETMWGGRKRWFTAKLMTLQFSIPEQSRSLPLVTVKCWLWQNWQEIAVPTKRVGSCCCLFEILSVIDENPWPLQFYIISIDWYGFVIAILTSKLTGLPGHVLLKNFRFGSTNRIVTAIAGWQRRLRRGQ